MKKLNSYVAKMLEEHRLDHCLEAMVQAVPWDDLMLALSNVCVASANTALKTSDKEYEAWMRRAYGFHGAILDKKTASINKREIKKVFKNFVKEESDSQ